MGVAKEVDAQIEHVDFDEFYRVEAAGQVRRAALLVGSDQVANDVVHDALAAMYQRWDRIESPGSYLNRAVLNGCRDVARRRATQRRLMDRLRAVREGPEEHGDHLDDVLARLPFNHRAAIVLRYWAGLSTAQIAALLGCPPGSIGPWIERGLSTLRKELQ